jgi:hypothetical protein
MCAARSNPVPPNRPGWCRWAVYRDAGDWLEFLPLWLGGPEATLEFWVIPGSPHLLIGTHTETPVP